MPYPSRTSPKALCGPRLWLRAHQGTADAGLAATAFALILAGTVAGVDAYRLGTLDTVLVALACASLCLRRRLPWAVLAFTCALSALYIALRPADGRIPVILAAAIALCTVVARTDHPASRPTTRTTGLAVCVGLTALAMAFGPGPWYCQENFAVFAWTGMAAAAGDAVRSRRAYITAVEERAARAERTREEEAKRRVAEERMRIARELHDVVAHHIALVNVQAGVAAHVMDSRPDQAKQALAHVREASRSALDELRATVGLLRQQGEPEAPMEPAPGLGVLDQLLDGFRRAGLRVSVEEHGAAHQAAPLPASVDLTAYRVIQESLTNVRKHAGPDATAVVRIRRGPEELQVVVDDDGVPGPVLTAAAGPFEVSGRADGSGQIGGSGQVDGSGRFDGSGRADGSGQVDASGRVDGSGRADAADAAGGSGRSSRSGGFGGFGGADAVGRSGRVGRAGSPGSGGSGGSAVPPGIPYPTAPADTPFGGHGLLGMHERASALGGVCRTGARPGGGFRVWVRLPLAAPPRSRTDSPGEPVT